MQWMPEVLEVCGVSDPDKLPKTGVYSQYDCLAISTPHFLNQVLYRDAFCEKLERRFKIFANLPENKHEPWLALMKDFAKKEGLAVEMIVYTYNEETDLDQDFQFILFKHDGQHYVLLHAHIGLDARVGFTEPKIFALADYDYFFDWRINVWCEHCDNDDYHKMTLKHDEEGEPMLICDVCGNQADYWNAADEF